MAVIPLDLLSVIVPYGGVYMKHKKELLRRLQMEEAHVSPSWALLARTAAPPAFAGLTSDGAASATSRRGFWSRSVLAPP